MNAPNSLYEPQEPRIDHTPPAEIDGLRSEVRALRELVAVQHALLGDSGGIIKALYRHMSAEAPVRTLGNIAAARDAARRHANAYRAMNGPEFDATANDTLTTWATLI